MQLRYNLLTNATKSAAVFSKFYRKSWKNRCEIMDYQNRQLRRLIQHAYTFVPYYHQLFREAGLTPSDIRTIDDLSKVPITSKQDLVQMNLQHRIAHGIRKNQLIERRTGGSTGLTTTICRTWFEERLLQVFRHQMDFFYGRRVRDKITYVNLVRDLQRQDNQILMNFANFFGLMRRGNVDCRQPVEKVAEAIQKSKPDIVIGFPGALTQVALAMGKMKVAPRFVVVGAKFSYRKCVSTSSEHFRHQYMIFTLLMNVTLLPASVQQLENII